MSVRFCTREWSVCCLFVGMLKTIKRAVGVLSKEAAQPHSDHSTACSSSTAAVSTTADVPQALAFVPEITVSVCVVGAQQGIEPRQLFRVRRNYRTHVVGPSTRYVKHTRYVRIKNMPQGTHRSMHQDQKHITRYTSLERLCSPRLTCDAPGISSSQKPIPKAGRGALYVVWRVFFLVFLFFFAHSCFPASVTGVVPPSPPAVLGFIFLVAHRVQQSHRSSIFHRVLLTRALALSASPFVHKKKSPRIYTSMHSRGFELTKLTCTRLEEYLTRHRGDRLHVLHANPSILLITKNDPSPIGAEGPALYPLRVY